MEWWKRVMVGLLLSGLATSDILRTDGLIIMDSGGYILVLMEKTVSGYGEKSMAGSGVTKQPGHFSGTMPVATGSTYSFVNNRILSFLITPPVNTGGKTNRTKFFKDKENQSSWTGF
jgi:hypothetical protein